MIQVEVHFLNLMRDFIFKTLESDEDKLSPQILESVINQVMGQVRDEHKID